MGTGYITILEEVARDRNLTPSEKLVYGEIDRLCGVDGCFAGNEYMADDLGLTAATVSSAVSTLVRHGYVRREKGEGGRRYLWVNREPAETRERPKKSDAHSEEVAEVVGYLNKVTGKRFSTSTSGTRSAITARLREGYTVENIKAVIDRKTSEWGNSPMRKYLRPQTLFGSKFEGYMNEECTVGSDKYAEYD